MSKHISLQDLEIIELKKRLAVSTAVPCGWCVGTSETIDSLEYQLEHKQKVIDDFIVDAIARDSKIRELTDQLSNTNEFIKQLKGE